MAELAPPEEPRWYALSVRFIAVGKLLPQLPDRLGERFVPPLMDDLLFIRTTREQIREWQQFDRMGNRLAIIYSEITRKPITIADAHMERFMLYCRLATACPIILTQQPRLRLGARVRILGGPLAGFEGHIVRMRKSRRVLIEFDGPIWMATEFISLHQLEVLEEAPAPQQEEQSDTSGNK